MILTTKCNPLQQIVETLYDNIQKGVPKSTPLVFLLCFLTFPSCRNVQPEHRV